MRRNILIILFIISLLPLSEEACAQYNFGLSLPKGKKSIIIPFELYNNLIVINIRFNNFITLNFILDTGVRSAILTDSKMALLLNPKYIRPIKIGGLGGDLELDAVIATGLSYNIAGLTGKDQLLVILTEDFFSLSKYIGKEIHGILGYEIFNRFVVEINYKNKFIRLHEPLRYEYKGKGERIPITIEDTKPFVNGLVRIRKKEFPVKLIVDTGAGHALALYPGTDPRIILPDTVIPSLLGRGLSGDIFGNIGRIKEFKLGKIKLNDIITSFPDSTDIGGTFTSQDRQGNLGAETLARFKVIFNYYSHYMILERKKKKKENKFYFNMSGLDVVAAGEDLKTFVVDHVRPNSPGSKNEIYKGDIILSINGRNSADLKLSDINGIFQSKPNRKIKLRLKRGFQILIKTLVLEELI